MSLNYSRYILLNDLLKKWQQSLTHKPELRDLANKRIVALTEEINKIKQEHPDDIIKK